ncbi:MAG: DEAD/DEAH box helicase [Nitrospinota bacterium]
MKFANYRFRDDLKRSISHLGFLRPTDIQYKSIPPILSGEDVLAVAQTGTGKTAAFAIPVLNNLLESNCRKGSGIQCLVMVPTRELAVQVSGVFEKLASHTGVKVFGVFGGVEQDSQIARLIKGVNVLVATPGRMFDLISQKYINLKRVKTLILDEADHMLDLGFIEDINDVSRLLPQKRQTLFFSATINKTIKELAYSLVVNPIRIQVSPKDPVAKNISHFVTSVLMDDKRFFLEKMIKEKKGRKILVFVRTRVRAERVLKAMKRVGIESRTIHGEKDQKERFNVLGKFKEGETNVLIATDVSARGIDIPNVDYVINYDLPEKPENYVHRVGRTGRGNNKGIAISFCDTKERPILDRIEGFLGKKIELLEIASEQVTGADRISRDEKPDWNSLIEEIEEFEAAPKKRKKRVKKKKK